jgi:predicted DNA-binding transcriptional regulator AlpA
MTTLDPFYVDATEAARLCGIKGRSTWYAKVKKKLVPQPVLIGGQPRWVVEELKRQHLANQTTTPSTPAA